ncbi:MAG: group I intron-associated PD-(D/E)XK endonuclease [Solirubrobacteraceae bacterium]
MYVLLIEIVKRDPRGQGDKGEISAALWFATRGAAVFTPLFHNNPHYDLIADWGEGAQRIQVKTSTYFHHDRWGITLCTRGGNRSWSGLVKRLDPTRYDYLFVLVGDGRRWLIPAAEVEGRSGLMLGGPKYAAYEIASDRPLLKASQR